MYSLSVSSNVFLKLLVGTSVMSGNILRIKLDFVLKNSSNLWNSTLVLIPCHNPIRCIELWGSLQLTWNILLSQLLSQLDFVCVRFVNLLSEFNLKSNKGSEVFRKGSNWNSYRVMSTLDMKEFTTGIKKSGIRENVFPIGLLKLLEGGHLGHLCNQGIYDLWNWFPLQP